MRHPGRRGPSPCRRRRRRPALRRRADARDGRRRRPPLASGEGDGTLRGKRYADEDLGLESSAPSPAPARCPSAISRCRSSAPSSSPAATSGSGHPGPVGRSLTVGSTTSMRVWGQRGRPVSSSTWESNGRTRACWAIGVTPRLDALADRHPIEICRLKVRRFLL